MRWKNRRYQLIEDTFSWDHSFTKIVFASDDIDLVQEYILNPKIKNIYTVSGGKIFYILDTEKDESINID